VCYNNCSKSQNEAAPNKRVKQDSEDIAAHRINSQRSRSPEIIELFSFFDAMQYRDSPHAQLLSYIRQIWYLDTEFNQISLFSVFNVKGQGHGLWSFQVILIEKKNAQISFKSYIYMAYITKNIL